MGVKGLWRLLLPIGRRISIEVLEGKVIAIDASIWLTQFLKAMRDPDTGSVKPGAHLIGFFRRLAKLRFHGIRPVLVFDGATPIIKLRELEQRRRRREQFAPTADGSVLRLAKRLLIQEIKKSKQQQKDNSEVLHVPGFNLPRNNQPSVTEPAGVKQKGSKIGFQTVKDETHVIDTSEAMARVLQEQEWLDEGEKGLLEPGPKAETSEEIALELQNEEWRLEHLDNQEEATHNDWDQPSDGSLSEREQKRPKLLHSLHPIRCKDGTLDANYLAALPAQARKDAVEEALREQRLVSRKEFMPVAGQPAEYSKAQLRNFLRSTRLNKSIFKMAQQAKESGVLEGIQIASDPSRRIIFEKFDREPNKKALSPKIPQQHCGESDSDIDWDIPSDKNTRMCPPLPASNIASKIRVIVDSSDDEEEELSFSHIGISAKGMSQNAALEIPSSDDSGERGFLKDTPQGTKIPSPTRVDITATLHHLKAPLEAQPSDDSSEGGFLKDTLQNPTNVEDKQASVPRRPVPCCNSALSDCNSEVKSPTSPQDCQVDSWISQSMHGTATRQGNIIDIDSHDSFDDSVDWEDGDDVPKSEVESDSGDEGEMTLLQRADEAILLDDTMKVTNHHEIGTNNLAALQQAQSTAAKLTDWAGRAFRRAIAQHQSETLAKITATGKAVTLSQQDSAALRIDEYQETYENDEGRHNNLNDVVATVGGGHSERYLPEKDDVAGFIGIVENHVIEVQQCPDRAIGGHADATEMEKNRPNLDSASRDIHQSGTGLEGSSQHSSQLVFSNVETERLLEEEEHLEVERRRQERDMETISDEMKSEVITLIQLFGIPFIESPAEAEAQCVALESLGLVDGIVTEDSDAFVFGGKVIYRNMFDDQKYVEVYRAEDALNEMSLGREAMVALAMLLGGDYTEGVKGVGIVNAMEIIETFHMSPNVKEGLQHFREWLDGFDPSDSQISGSEAIPANGLHQFHATHKSARLRWVCPSNFPAENVLNAYLNPVVDNSREKFSWGVPDVDELVKFCSRNMGWESSETRRLLDPVVKRLDGGMLQTRLDAFMTYSDNIQFAKIRSKRLRRVLDGVKKEVP